MRHLNSGRKLKRTHSHRKATLSALSTALLTHKRIKTTVAKAKETRMVVEKLITRAKNAVTKETEKKDVAARRYVYDRLRSRIAVTTLFNDIAPKVASRPGGYTRVVKLGRRLGDGAEIAMLELVDFNLGQEKAATKATKKTASKKQSGKSKKSAPPVEQKNAETPPVQEAQGS